MLPTIEVVSVNIGQPQIIGQRQGEAVWSSIRKHPVQSRRELYLTSTGLAGDQQSDTHIKEGKTDQLHGGPLKAVYAFPQEHIDAWVAEWGVALYPGTHFGENLTISGVDESSVFVGDIWAWGDALLQVTEPRQPCYKLAIATKRSVIKQMWQSGRCGWYLSVLRPGVVPTTGAIEVTGRLESALTVAEAFALKRAKNAPAEVST